VSQPAKALSLTAQDEDSRSRCGVVGPEPNIITNICTTVAAHFILTALHCIVRYSRLYATYEQIDLDFMLTICVFMCAYTCVYTPYCICLLYGLTGTNRLQRTLQVYAKTISAEC